jgi:hypothetical protein
LLSLPGQLPGIIGFGPIAVVDQQVLIDAIAVFDDECAAILPIVENFDSTVDRGYFLAQKMPAKVRLAGRLPAGAFSSIQGDFHSDLLSGLAGNLVLFQYVELSCKYDSSGYILSEN